MADTQPFGALPGGGPARFDAESVVRSSPRRSEIRAFGDLAAFIEARPVLGPGAAGSKPSATRVVLVGIAEDGTLFDITPPELNPRTRVNEYGGGAWWPLPQGEGWAAVVVDGATGHLWSVPVSVGSTATLAECRQITVDAGGGQTISWADGCATPDGAFCVAVRERSSPLFPAAASSIMELATVRVADGSVTILAAGSDFFSSPRISPNGREIAWISWDLPDMPWHNTTLWRAGLKRSGDELDIYEPRAVVTGDTDRGREIERGVSSLDPTWDAGGDLWFVSDVRPTEDGDRYWAAYRNSPSASPWPGAFELGRPHWVFGMARYGLVSAGSPGDTWLVGGITLGGIDRLVALVPGRPEPVPLASGIDQVASLAVGEASVFAVVGGPKLNNAVVRLSRRTLSDAVLGSLQPDEPEVLTADDGVVGAVSVPRPVSFSVAPRRVAGGRDPVATAHGLLYLPNPAIDRELAPLVVMIHGGPTGVADPQYNPRYQFWTQRGYALLDVNYRGSTGFGRHYRGALNGWWGIADVEDCIAGAQSLVEAGIADPQRLAIRGSSAGGFTVLNTLASSDLFRCGVTLYGVSDPSLLVAETHRFESTYLDSLIAPWPEGAAEYERRSPMARLGSITASVLVFQGEEDRVVPVDQALMLVEGLRARGSHVEYHQFADEAHGFRGPEVQAFVLRRELEFYEQQFAG